jgi:hypothetical protein
MSAIFISHRHANNLPGQNPWLTKPPKNGAALIIVLAFVVLLSGLIVAYFSRTTIDRQLAKSSFDNTAADLLARSALEIIVGDFKQEIVNGSTGSAVHAPNSNADIVPRRSGDSFDVPNLIRRSVRSDGLGSPAVPSRASAVNSAADLSANGRSVTPARWNKHYLIPRRPPGSGETATTIYTDPVSSFIAPDWVLVRNLGPSVMMSPDSSVTGRYAYAVYDEGGLLDLNVAGFPSANSTHATYLRNIGRKGVLAFADLTVIGLSVSSASYGAIDNIIGWRNYFTAQPTGSYGSFGFPSNPTNFVTYFLDTSRDFGIAARPATYSTGSRIDQSLINRTELLELRRTLTASQDALQYLGTFSRESNHSTWSNSITQLAARFALTRFDLFATTPPANPAAIQQYFGLVYVAASGSTAEHWRYCGTSGGNLLSTIPPVSGNNQNPDLFPLLQYALPSGISVAEIFSIGASLIDQRDGNNATTWIEFAAANPLLLPQKAFGVDRDASTEADAPPRPAAVVVLNHEFRNVGEIGYAYRNASSSLNFRTASSPDAPLLDLFTYNTAALRSGIVNLNTRSVPAIAAVIKGALPTDSSTTGVTESDATVAATAIVNATTMQPALGRQDITRLAGLVVTTPFATNEETNETIARALAEVAQTRTWGLMIDVIAQSGRYRPNASSLADFIVQGEKRYWLHLAIDRFTGQVIDQQLEAVFE